jgi:hypothetical protein
MNDTELDQVLDSWTAPAVPPSIRRGLAAALPRERRRVFGVPVRWVVAFAAAAVCAVLGAKAFDNPVLGRYEAAVTDSGASVKIQITRMISPPVAKLKWWFAVDEYSIGGPGAGIHGSADMHVRSTRTFYGYKYLLEPADEGQYRVTFLSLDLATVRKNVSPYKFDGQIAALPNVPAPQTVRVGQPFEVTLFQNGSERIYDRFVITRKPPDSWKNATAQEFALGRTMHLVEPHLYVNGQLVAIPDQSAAAPGVWFHLPGQGRFLAALDAEHNPRFVQGGSVNGNVLEFQSEGIQFRIVCSEPIVAGGSHPLYVYHQQSYEDQLDPADPETGKLFMGYGGSANVEQ